MNKKIFKNTAILGFSNLTARLVGFFYFIILGRFLGVESFGHYNFALALVYNFYPVADLGIERLILRDISKDKEMAQKYFQKIIPLRFFLALISIILINLAGIFLSKNTSDRINIFLFSFCLIPWTFNQLVAGIGNAFEQMEVQSIAAISSTGLTALFGGLIVLSGGNVSQLLIGAFLANAIVSLEMLGYSKKMKLIFKIEFDIKFWKEILHQSWVFALIMIMAVFYLRTSIVMVNFFKGSYYTGLYSSVFKFIEASILIPQSLALALFPQMARLLDTNKKKLAKDYFLSMAIILLICFPFYLIFYFFPEILIRIAYGERYLNAISTAKILSFSFFLFFLNALPGNIIQSSSKIREFLPFAFLNLLAVFLFCLYLIPKYSIEGAAWAVLSAEGIGFLINNVFVWKILHEKD